MIETERAVSMLLNFTVGKADNALVPATCCAAFAPGARARGWSPVMVGLMVATIALAAWCWLRKAGEPKPATCAREHNSRCQCRWRSTNSPGRTWRSTPHQTRPTPRASWWYRPPRTRLPDGIPGATSGDRIGLRRAAPSMVIVSSADVVPLSHRETHRTTTPRPLILMTSA